MIKTLFKDKMKIVILFLLILIIIDIPMIYVNYKSNTAKKLMYEQMSETIYRIPNYVNYVSPIAYSKLKKGEVVNITKPIDMQYVLSKFSKSDWANLIHTLPENDQSEIQVLADKYKLIY